MRIEYKVGSKPATCADSVFRGLKALKHLLRSPGSTRAAPAPTSVPLGIARITLFVIFGHAPQRPRVIVSFADAGTEDLFNREDTKAARRACPISLWRVARRKLDQLNAVPDLESLRIPPGNRLEALKGSRVGQYGIRVNDQYRICFRWTSLGPTKVEVVDYH